MLGQPAAQQQAGEVEFLVPASLPLVIASDGASAVSKGKNRPAQGMRPSHILIQRNPLALTVCGWNARRLRHPER